jgi:glucokinase
VGFDLGGTKMLAEVYDEKFKSVGTERKRTKGYLGQEIGMERIIETIKEAMVSGGIHQDELGGIGIGVPGPVNLDKGVMVSAPNLGWSEVPIKAILEKTFRCPVQVANDVDIGLYGEYRFGAARKSRCAIGVFPGTGIGGGCIYEGKIFRGSMLSCMEIGHAQMLQGGPAGGGSLEALASRLAICSAAAVAAYRGKAPYLMKHYGTDLSDIRSGALAASVKSGDKEVEEIIRKAAQWLGLALANTINLFSPDTIVLGGGLVEAMPELYLGEVERTANKIVMPTYKGTYKVKVAELGDYAAVRGAAAWAEACSGGKK